MRSIANVLGFLLLAGTLLAQTNPVPFVSQPLVPTTVAPGSAGFTLTINGTGFVSGSVVNWNGSPRTTTFVSTSELTATILATDVLIAGTASVTVHNPAPGGGGSNPALFPIATARTSLSFSTSAVTSGGVPQAAKVADVNGDGNADLIVPNNLTGTVGVLLGNGDGTFRPEVDYATAQGPLDVAIADLNGDGKLDLAVTVSAGSGGFGSVSILLGNGDGTFQPRVDYATSYTPLAPFALDLNRDGKLDLVVCVGNGIGGISVLLGNGDGTFQPHKEYATAGAQTFGVAVGDFNHDGILDVVTANVDAATVSLLLGKGDGSFQTHVDYPVGTSVDSVTAADFNGDGNLDVAASNAGGSVSILLGRGDGTFQPQVQYSVGSSGGSITTADVNGDGHLDLALATGSGVGSLSLLLGNGDGTFQPHVDFTIGPAGQLSAADFNKDGLIDFAINNTGVSTVIQDHGTVVVLSASSVTFGTLLVGSVSLPQTVTLTNTGSSAISISSVSVGTVNFAVSNRCPTSVKPGQSCRLLVFFTPTASGSLTDFLSIYDTGGGSPQTVSLSGTGTVVTVSPASLNFGGVAVHKTSPPQTVTLTNRGSVRLTITKITVTGTNKNDFFEVNACGTSLVAGASCTISVYFTPLAKGTRNASLSITDTGGGSPQLVALTGTGQ